MSTHPVRKTDHSSAKSQTKSPIRIVPLHPHVRDAAAPAPHLTYRNGPLLTNVEVFTIFWGAAWQDPANLQLSQQMNSFFDFILTSPLLDQLSEYSVPGKNIGHGIQIGTKILHRSRAWQNRSGFRHPVAAKIRIGQRHDSSRQRQFSLLRFSPARHHGETGRLRQLH